MKKDPQATVRQAPSPALPLPGGDDSFPVALQLLRKAMLHGQHDPVPDGMPGREQIVEMLLHVRRVHRQLADLARGVITTPVPVEGYTGILLQELRDKLNRVLWKARRLTVGDFSHDAGSMGELSETFEVMGKTLQAALARLEQQKQDLTDLSENLRREIDARVAIENDLRREQSRLQKLAATDPLTGIANRRHFFQEASRELERIRRTKVPACLAMLDIDHFKELNDTLGHSAGDKALQTIVKIMTGIVRPYDIIGRYGGDEFIFLFPEISRDQAHALLERIRGAIERAKILTGEGNACITVSIGLIELAVEKRITASTLDNFIKRADDSLYEAKKQSRNHICIL